MIFSQDRDALRRYYFDVWQRYQQRQPLAPLEQLIADVIALHPEYHPMLASDPARQLDRDYTPEEGQTNPFLHLGMHLAIREQVMTDRPVGIRRFHQQLSGRTGDDHRAEHQMMEVLGEVLWQAQRSRTPPDEQLYLELLRQRLGEH